jgi:phosphoribosyl 1,2-cyclic phosphodiesterase
MKIGVTALGSGSRGNAFVIQCGEGGLLVDAGFSRRDLLNRMAGAGVDPKLLKALLVTHEHEDHVRGMRLFCQDYSLPACMTGRTADYLRRKKTIAERVIEFAAGTVFEAAGFSVLPFQVQHDAVEPVGFVLSRGGFRIGLATDLGAIDLLARTRLANSDVLILESNYDLNMLQRSDRQLYLKRRIMGRNGHLDNQAALNALENLISPRTQVIFLVHISSQCNTYQLVRELAQAKLRELGREDIRLEIVEQAEPVETVWM